ncbi:MAG: 30S ribosome-binding factor RbfA [Bacteroidales bacterium]|nr:30S ribosome-binding factor RbfA [Bacteroidales bacterium]
MYSQRQNKVGRLIQKELAAVLQKEGRNLFQGAMLTITVVRMSPDLSIAKVYLSIFPSNKADEIMQNIDLQAVNLRRLLGNEISKQVRIIPELKFFPDDSQDYAQRIDDLLKEN